MSLMIIGVVAVAVSSAGQPAGNGVALANRFHAAIRGQAGFHDSDFARPLGAADKSALRGFAACKVQDVNYRWMPDPVEADTYIPDHNRVLVTFGCPGVPSATPAGITLHLREGRISRVETHNADLMGSR